MSMRKTKNSFVPLSALLTNSAVQLGRDDGPFASSILHYQLANLVVLLDNDERRRKEEVRGGWGS